MEIPFDIKYRPQIESGEYKVKTKDGKSVRIICWDKKSQKKYGYHIVGLIEFGPQHEESTYYTIDGKGRLKDKEPELFIVTPEQEMSEFEKAVDAIYESCGVKELQVKKKATELLALAREQFIKDGYVIEKKAFHDAVENISNKHLAEMSVEYSIHCKIEDGTRHAIMNWEAFQKVAQKFIDIGKAEALKDLPRWKKDKSFETEGTFMGIKGRGYFVVKGGYSISVAELIKKLPGFNED